MTSWHITRCHVIFNDYAVCTTMNIRITIFWDVTPCTWKGRVVTFLRAVLLPPWRWRQQFCLERNYLQRTLPHVTLNCVRRIMLGITHTYYLMPCFAEGVQCLAATWGQKLRAVFKKIQAGQSKRWGKSHGNCSFNVCYPSKQARPIVRVTKNLGGGVGEIGGAFGTH